MMNDPQNEKIEGASIHLPEREHGKFYRWLDNFWYHHKWKTLFALFLLILALIAVFQMCERKQTKADLNVVCAGPYGFAENEVGRSDLTNALSLYLPEDYDGNGTRRVEVVSYTVYTAKEIAALTAEGYDEATLRSFSSSQFETLATYLMTGDALVLFLAPEIFAQYVSRLVDLSEVLDGVPEAARVMHEDKWCGVRLYETSLWEERAFQVLPAETVVCLMHPISQSGAAEYARATAFLKALFG